MPPTIPIPLPMPRAARQGAAPRFNMRKWAPYIFISPFFILFGVFSLFPLLFSIESGRNSSGADVVVQNGFAQINMQVIVFTLLALTLFVFVLTRWVSRKQKVVRDVTWDCGYTGLLPQMEITATGFSRSLVLIFKGLFQPTQQKKVAYVDANVRYFTKVHSFNFMTKDVFESYWYHPLHAFTIRATKKLKQLQGGNLNIYILYIFLTLIGLLLWIKYS